MPHIEVQRPRVEHYAAGPCPYCGRLDTWLNNIPLTAYCWGIGEGEHSEWSKVIPNPHNPYLPGYDPTQEVESIEYEDRRSEHLKQQG